MQVRNVPTYVAKVKAKGILNSLKVKRTPTEVEEARTIRSWRKSVFEAFRG